MKVRMRTAYAGPNGNHAIGALVDFDKKEARALIAGGYAEPAEEEENRRARAEKAAAQEAEAKEKAAKGKAKETATPGGAPETAVDKAKT